MPVLNLILIPSLSVCQKIIMPVLNLISILSLSVCQKMSENCNASAQPDFVSFFISVV